MPKNLIEQLEQKYLAEQLSDLVGDKLTLPLTVLRHLHDGKHIEQHPEKQGTVLFVLN